MKTPLFITTGKTKGNYFCTCGAADYCGSPKACTKEILASNQDRDSANSSGADSSEHEETVGLIRPPADSSAPGSTPANTASA